MRLVLDWDGTCTVQDTLQLALQRFGDREVFDRVERDLVDGTLSYRQVMEAEMATITAPVAEVSAWLRERVELRAGFRELVRQERPLILSSGFHELIEPLLAREGVDAEVRANRLEETAAGWRIRWRDDQPCPVCGDLCKRRTLPEPPFAYVGDGYSDRCAALVADRIWAIGGLADWLEEQGVPFERFADLRDVA